MTKPDKGRSPAMTPGVPHPSNGARTGARARGLGWKPWARLSGAVLATVLLINATWADEAPGQPASTSEMLTLRGAVELALERNPVLASFAWDIRAGDARILQAGLRPNPELSVEIEDIGLGGRPKSTKRAKSVSGSFTGAPVAGYEVEKESEGSSGFSEAEVTISIAQAIELGGKRAKRVALADKEKQLILWDYEAARADVIAQVGKAFVAVLAARDKLALEEELVQLAEEVARTCALRVEAGQVSPLEKSKAELALAQTRVSRDQAAKELNAAGSRLAATWGATQLGFAGVEGALDETPSMPSLEDLGAEIRRNPDVARWSAELACRDAELKLERARRVPDPTLEIGLRTKALPDGDSTSYGFGSDGSFSFSRSETRLDTDRESSLVLGLSVPLPLFDRNQGNIAAAESMVSKIADERRASEVSVHAALSDAYEASASALLELDALRGEIIPKANDILSKTRRGYREGKFQYLDVLDAQRTLFDARTSYIDAQARFHEAAVDVERLTGKPTTGIDRENDTTNEDKTDAQ